MNELVLIIGINGVGKEHIKACNTLGLPYILYDVNISDFEGKSSVWNVWGSHKEEIKIDNLLILTDNLTDIIIRSCSHAIIATPDVHHSFYADALVKASPLIKIFVEKPALCNFVNVDYVGYTKLNIGDIVYPCDITFCVEKVVRSWNNHIAEDLLGHLYYTYLIHKVGLFSPIKKILVDEENHFGILLEDKTKLSVKRNCDQTYLLVNGQIRYNNYEEIFLHQLENFILHNRNNVHLAKYVETGILNLIK